MSVQAVSASRRPQLVLRDGLQLLARPVPPSVECGCILVACATGQRHTDVMCTLTA